MPKEFSDHAKVSLTTLDESRNPQQIASIPANLCINLF